MHKCNSPTLACLPTAPAHNKLNTRSLRRLTLFIFMEDQFVTTNRQSKQMTKKTAKKFISEQRSSYFLPSWCAYLSHIHFHSCYTRAPPASRDS